MDIRDFLDNVATIFNRENWADFTVDEDRMLTELFIHVDECAFQRGVKEASPAEGDIENAWQDGYSDGYADGDRDGRTEGLTSGYKAGYDEAVEDYKVGKFENPNAINYCFECKNFGCNANQGWNWCQLQNKHFAYHPEYCRDFEKRPESITTHT